MTFDFSSRGVIIGCKLHCDWEVGFNAGAPHTVIKSGFPILCKSRNLLRRYKTLIFVVGPRLVEVSTYLKPFSRAKHSSRVCCIGWER